jgi:hypothetical protein
MRSEDRLDALLTRRVETRRSWQSANDIGDTGDLQPLMDAADRLAEVADENPSDDFVARLEALFFARAASLRERVGTAPLPQTDDATSLPLLDAPPYLGYDVPTIPGIEWGAVSNDATLPDGAPVQRPIGTRRRPMRQPMRQQVWRRVLWTALAATLLIAIGLTTFTAAAQAGPGSPLYGLRQWEQNLQANIIGSAVDRTQFHIGNAQDALDALNAAIANHHTDSTYDDALATFRNEARAAATNLDRVPAGKERDALASQLELLHTTGIADLHTALPSLSWPQRIETTSVLSEIGDQVLIVAQVSMVYSERGQHLWIITISGSGFQQGAVLLVNGQPVNATTSVTPATVVAKITGDDSTPQPSTIGIGNSDLTAAVTTSITSHEMNDDDGTPGTRETPEIGDPSGSHDGSGSGSSGASATPTGTGGPHP